MPHYRFSFKSWVCSSIIVLSYFYFWNWTFIFTFLSTFFIVLVHLLVLLSMNIIRLVDLVPENLATWVENARSSSCSNGVCLFSSLKAVVNLTSFSPVSSLQKWLITHKHWKKHPIKAACTYIQIYYLILFWISWSHDVINIWTARQTNPVCKVTNKTIIKVTAQKRLPSENII